MSFAYDSLVHERFQESFRGVSSRLFISVENNETEPLVFQINNTSLIRERMIARCNDSIKRTEPRYEGFFLPVN